MSWRDRPYAGDRGGGWHQGQGMGFSLPKPTRVVTCLLVINIGIFVLVALSEGLRGVVYYYGMMANRETVTSGGRVLTGGGVLTGQVWRLVTYQYLHDTRSAIHLLFNMLGLYFLGPPLERRWGGRTFFGFYTLCGVAGAVFYTLLTLIGFLDEGVMVGASGSVLGLLAGCAVLTPEMMIILVFFPVPIRFAAVLFVVLYVLNLLTAFANQDPSAGGDAAHLGGMAFGAAWCLWGWQWLQHRRERLHEGAWERKLKRQQDLENEVDRILAKVHDQGIQSLTRREKQTLAQATETQREDQNKSRNL